MGNSFAVIALMVWPFVAALIFSRTTTVKAIIWTIIGGYLLLPPAVEIPSPLPVVLNKDTIAVLSALLGTIVSATKDPETPRLEGWVKTLMVIYVFTPVLTAFANPEPLIEGITYRPGLGPYDGFLGIVAALVVITPFLLGYRFLSSAEGMKLLLRSLVVACLAYAVPMLIEIRLSPQINVWIYGFFAHDFSQAIRYGGFRPMVFLAHGLWVAMFTAMALIAAAYLMRSKRHLPGHAGRRAIVGGLTVLLVMCKSLAAIVYGMFFLPLVLLTSARRQILVASVITGLVFAYPIGRWMQVVPTEAISNFALGIDQERGRSLTFRLDNEDLLLERAVLKPLFGWGGWGRNQVIDPNSGRYISVTDGEWIVQLTIYGFLGYIGIFGLLCGTVIRMGASAWRWGAPRRDKGELVVGAISLIMAASLIDLIPNATLTTLTWLCAGALAGNAARLAQRGPAPDTDATPAPMAGRRLPLRTIL